LMFTAGDAAFAGAWTTGALGCGRNGRNGFQVGF